MTTKRPPLMDVQDQRRFLSFVVSCYRSTLKPLSSVVKHLPNDVVYNIWLEFMTSGKYALSELIDHNLSDCVKYAVLCKNMPLGRPKKSFVFVCNSVEMCQWLFQNNRPLDPISVVSSSNILVVEYGVGQIIADKQFDLSVFTDDSFPIDPSFVIFNLMLIHSSLSVFVHFLTKFYANKSDLWWSAWFYCAVRRRRSDIADWFLQPEQNFQLQPLAPIKHFLSDKTSALDDMEQFVRNSDFLTKNRLPTLKVFSDLIAYTDENRVLDLLITNGQLDEFVWLHEKFGFKCTYAMVKYAIDRRQETMASYIYQNRNDRYTLDEAISWTCSFRHLELLQFFLKVADFHNTQVEVAIRESTIYGALRLLEWLNHHFNHLFQPKLIGMCIQKASDKLEYVRDIERDVEKAISLMLVYNEKFFLKPNRPLLL